MAPPPFSSADYLTNNSWSGTVDNEPITIFAGAVGGNSSQGVVIVESVNANGSTTLTPFVSPTANGTLTIESIKSNVLTLTSSGGGVFQFDANSDAFTGS
jgi:hypothetical protein